MKNRFLPLLFILLYLQTNSQVRTEKTIFELLKIKDEQCPLNGKVQQSPLYSIERDERKGIQEFSVSDALNQEMVIKNHFETNKNREIPYTKIFDFYKGKSGVNKLYKKGKDYKLVDSDGKLLLSDTFEYVDAQQGDDYGFNAYKKGTKSLYYNYEGVLIFNGLFDFVIKRENGYFIISNNGKFGIADSKGKLVLPAIYESASPIKKDKKLFFKVSDSSGAYIFENGNKNPICLDGGYYAFPYALNDQYWVESGKVYDVLKRKKLFCNIKEYIEVFDADRKWFYIRNQQTGMQTVFDLQGNLLTDQDIVLKQNISSSEFILGIPNPESSNKSKYSREERMGIASIKPFKWKVKPDYSALYMLDSNVIVFKKIGEKGFVGIMDNNAKTLIDDNKYTLINKTPLKGVLLCINEITGISELVNLKTKKTIKLSRNFKTIEETYVTGIYQATYVKEKRTLMSKFLNEKFEEIKLPEFRNSYYDDNNAMFVCTLDNGEMYSSYEDKKMYLNNKLVPVSFDINGTKYNTIRYLRFLSSKAKLFEVDESNYYLKVDTIVTRMHYNNIFHDSLNNYIVINSNGVYGISDFYGHEILPVRFNFISYNYQSDYIIATVNDRQNYIFQKNGKLLFNGKYINVKPIFNNLFIVYDGMNYGIVNVNDQILFPLEYKFIEKKYGGVFLKNQNNVRKFYPSSYFF